MAQPEQKTKPEGAGGGPPPAPRVLAVGTVFLLLQLLFAANNYGPQRIPLLNLVFDSPWVAPRQVAAPSGQGGVWFEDVTEEAGLAAFRRAPFYDALPRYLEVMGGGVAVGDYDGDGWEDVFLTSLPAFDARLPDGAASTLFRNRGDGTFEDVTAGVGLGDLNGYPQGALFLDFDNDGDQDLYVAAYEGGQLFRNDPGSGQARRFTDHTTAAGLDLSGRCGALPCFSSGAAAADYDRDGHLDLLVVNNVSWDLGDPVQHGERHLFPAFFDAQHTFLFRNLGDGTFTDVTEASGLDNRGGKGLSAVWVDVNDDGWPDAYIANDLTRNTLYLNGGDGTFRELARAAGVDEIKSSMGVAAADFDNDGRMDLATTNLKGAKLSLFRNQGGLRFDYATDYAGLTSSIRASGWGLVFVDFDLDGHMDIVSGGGPVWERAPSDTQNLFYRNLGGGRFEDVSGAGTAFRRGAVSRGLAVLDYDRSGPPDLLFANADGEPPLLLKSYPAAGHAALRIRLEGVASNRDGIGARVTVARSDGLRMTQEVQAGSSYQSGSTRTLAFGLARARADEVTVRWPSGAVDVLRDLPQDRVLLVREGVGLIDY